LRKHILVTGGAGFIGSHFVDVAVANGYTPIVLDLMTYAANISNIQEHLNSGNAGLIVGNILDNNLVSMILNKYNIQSIVNFAAESHVDNSIASPESFINTNILGVYRLLEAARKYCTEKNPENFRFIQVSTDEVYGSLKEAEPKFNEDSRYKPNSPYAASKASGDHLARAWFKTYNFPVITTNCSNNYGPRQHFEKLIPTIISKAYNHQYITIYGTGQNVRDWIHVKDHARGILLALEKGKLGETYIFGSNSEIDNNEVARIICEDMDKKSPSITLKNYASLIKYVEDRKGHDFRYAVDYSKAKTELDFNPKYYFELGIKNTVDWYLEQLSQESDFGLRNFHNG
jgi:dTDP-glucose 4,6-dehydratase